VFWQAFFTIYPFTQDREDQRFAMLASVLSYVSGRTLKNPVPEKTFIPDYLGERKPTHEPTLAEQEAQMKAFADKLKAATGQK